MKLRYPIAFLAGCALLLAPALSVADHTPNPSVVTIPGNLQDELGCAGDWDPGCAVTNLIYDVTCDVWSNTFTLPAGSWEYKAALNGTWDENYGLFAQQNGANIPLSLPADTPVKFYYDHNTHWITDNWSSVIVTAPGSYQNEIGCTGDWTPDCLCSWLQDPDGDGVYTWWSSDIPPDSYEVKIAINESWDENYGAGGVPGGANIPFAVGEGEMVHFSYDHSTHILMIDIEVPPVQVQTQSWGSLKAIYR
jgi:hypothetical protein